MFIDKKIKCVPIVLSLIFVASIINHSSYGVDNDAPRRRRLEITNTRVLTNGEIMNQLIIKPWNVIEKLPCVPEDSPNNQGIFYIKVPKTSSSTLAGITSRMAAKESLRRGFPIDQYCKTHDPMVHLTASDLESASRDKKNSFLWTVVRHPNDRAVSHFGMWLSRDDVVSRQEVFRENLLNKPSFKTNTQLAFMSTKNLNNYTIADEDIAHYVQDILDEYDFVGIYERLHESLVVMSMITGLNINDVIFDFRPIKYARCGSLEEPYWLDDEMRTFLKSAEWKRKQKADFIMYKALNEKLDRTIDTLGRRKVQKKLAEFDKLIYVGTYLSSRTREMNGCGVLFRSIYGDIDGLDNFNELSRKVQRFVMGTLGKL